MANALELDLIQHLSALAFAALLTLIAFLSAKKMDYFSWPLQNKEASYISLKDCIKLFSLFIFLQIFIIPTIVYFGFFHLKSNIEVMGWLNLGAIGMLSIALGIYFFLQKEKIKNLFVSPNPWFDLFFGSLSWLVAFPAAMLVSQVMVLILTDFLGYNLNEQTAVQEMKNVLEFPRLFWLLFISVVFVVPFLEEMLFRGYLQTCLRPIMGTKIAIIITAMLFALFHFSFSQGVNNFNILSSLFVLALFLGFIRERQGNLLAPIALHATFNAISVMMVLFQNTDLS